MKKLFGRDKARQQEVIPHRDVSDFIIDDDAPLVRPKRPLEGHRDWEVLPEPLVPSSPYPQFAVPPISPSRSSSLASIPPVILPARSSSPYSATSHTTTIPTPTPTPQTNPNPTHPATLRRDGRGIRKPQHVPIALGILKALDPHLDHAEKKVKKSFWDGIIRDRDMDKDKERGRDKERETREKEKEREKDKEGRDHIWREEDNPSELTRMIGYLTATSSEDWTLVLEVCERASATEANAKEAMKALRREFKCLWAIMLRNASDMFLTQISSRTFIDTLEDVLTSPRTSPVVRERLMEVLAAAAFITNSRPNPSPKSEPSPFSLKDRNRDRDGFRGLWMRLKPADKPDVGVPFDTEDAMFSPPIVPTRPPLEKRPSKKSLHQRGVLSSEEDMKRLFQECKIAKGNATFLSEMLTYAKPEQIEGSLVPEFLAKCRGSQELIYTQIPWASAGAERSRNERERNAEGNGRTKSQHDVQFSSSPSQDYHGVDAKFDINAEGEEQTSEEELLVALHDASEALTGALRMYDDIMRVGEEQVAAESRDVKIDRRHMENEHLGDSYPDYGGSSSRTPSPIPSPPASPHQHDLPPIVPSQNHPLPQVPPALSPAHPHYGSPLQNMSTPTLLVPPPPPPLGPRSLPTPSPPPYNTSLMRPSVKVVEEVDDVDDKSVVCFDVVDIEQQDSSDLHFALETAVPTHSSMKEEVNACQQARCCHYCERP
ncbi:hypothetical protein F4604DRAFT_1762121 [Suillus subluteus]|nr:hypothetical protein F4604DRAFT_1762121 [Suillus subluteus]